MMTQALLHRLRGSRKVHLVSSEDLRTLCNELRDKGNYQILAAYSENEKTERVDVTISIQKA